MKYLPNNIYFRIGFCIFLLLIIFCCCLKCCLPINGKKSKNIEIVIDLNNVPN